MFLYDGLERDSGAKKDIFLKIIKNVIFGIWKGRSIGEKVRARERRAGFISIKM